MNRGALLLWIPVLISLRCRGATDEDRLTDDIHAVCVLDNAVCWDGFVQ